MKSLLLCLFCFLQIAALSASAQESPQPTVSKPATSPQVASPPAPKEPRPEMRKLMAFSGRWLYRYEYPAAEGSTTGKTTEGKAVFRSGPGGLSLIQDDVETEGGKTTVGHTITWWDEKSHGYKALWCDTENPDNCTLMSQVGKWEGDQFVIGNEFTKDGRKYLSKEVWSEITPNSFTRTVSQGEQGKELKPVVTIHATKAGKGMGTTVPAVSPKGATPAGTATPNPK